MGGGGGRGFQSDMATYSPNIHIIGKLEIDSFLLSQKGYLEFIFTELLIDMSSTFHKTFVHITEIDWARATKWVDFRKQC